MCPVLTGEDDQRQKMKTKPYILLIPASTLSTPFLMHSSLKLFMHSVKFLLFFKQMKNLLRNERTDTAVFGQGLQSVMMFQLWCQFDGGCNIKMSL